MTASVAELCYKTRNLLDDLNVGYSVTILTGGGGVWMLDIDVHMFTVMR